MNPACEHDETICRPFLPAPWTRKCWCILSSTMRAIRLRAPARLVWTNQTDLMQQPVVCRTMITLSRGTHDGREDVERCGELPGCSGCSHPALLTVKSLNFPQMVLRRCRSRGSGIHVMVQVLTCSFRVCGGRVHAGCRSWKYPPRGVGRGRLALQRSAASSIRRLSGSASALVLFHSLCLSACVLCAACVRSPGDAACALSVTSRNACAAQNEHLCEVFLNRILFFSFLRTEKRSMMQSDRGTAALTATLFGCFSGINRDRLPSFAVYLKITMCCASGSFNGKQVRRSFHF